MAICNNSQMAIFFRNAFQLKFQFSKEETFPAGSFFDDFNGAEFIGSGALSPMSTKKTLFNLLHSKLIENGFKVKAKTGVNLVNYLFQLLVLK